MLFCRDCMFAKKPADDDTDWSEWVCASPQVQAQLEKERKYSPVTGEPYPQMAARCFLERGVDCSSATDGRCNMSADHFVDRITLTIGEEQCQ